MSSSVLLLLSTSLFKRSTCQRSFAAALHIPPPSSRSRFLSTTSICRKKQQSPQQPPTSNLLNASVSKYSTTPRKDSIKGPETIDFSKYPAIKPNPYTQNAKQQRPPVTPSKLNIGGGRHNNAASFAPPEQTHRRVRKQMLTALALWFSAMVVYQIWVQPMLLEASSDTNKAMKDATVVIVKETTVGGDTVDTVDSGTRIGALPTRIFLPTQVNAGISDISGARASEVLEEYSLVGHGIRTVSFLSVQVYVVALYVATSSLPNLQNSLLSTLDIPSTATTATLPEREALRKKLLEEQGSTDFYEGMLSMKNEAGVKMAIRIVPTRNTDFPHLRDGWVRSITAATKHKPEIYDDEQFVSALDKFKSLFGGKGSVPKGGVLLLARDEKGALFAYGPDENMKDVIPLVEGGKKNTAMHGLKLLGAVSDERISRALWLGYWAGKKVASEGARRSVVEGMIDIVERPVGSSEGRVV